MGGFRDAQAQHLAAGADGGRQPVGTVAHQDKIGLGGGLLQRLEQGIGGAGIHVFRRAQHRDLAQAETGGAIGEIHQRPHGVYLDDPTLAFRRQPQQVPVVATAAEVAGMAVAAVEAVHGRLAQQQPGQGQGKARLAAVLGAAEQQRVGQLAALQLLQYALPGGSLPGQGRRYIPARVDAVHGCWCLTPQQATSSSQTCSSCP